MDLTDKVVLITGGRRIGASVATELARRGAKLSLSFWHSEDDAHRAATVIREAGHSIITTRVDLTEPSECYRLIDETVSKFGRIDVLINMASTYNSTPLAQLDELAWDRALAVDAKASYLCALAALPHLRAIGDGRIINFSDWIAKSGRPQYLGYLPYYVAKSAVVALTEALALELAEDGILVNAIAPGPIRAPSGTNSQEKRAVEQATPLGRWGGDHAIVKAVVALIESDFITGETIRVDGGRHLK